ncbi:hypothetical protein Rsub_10386 [Raphidocelis subcapitata]|uniref:Uncharacterized protein n=1 Tax=Raphidocelis subcapitata TaxID=307507 RepID=A0A2V0PHS0_9CHLO|nr:hypothetical protein Rsub_10386 [Raphidocelis subcapitata]|eukprot:GBF97463.1 hypothetical protein Rsub_10386 [Raphidocelis subcapitata]
MADIDRSRAVLSEFKFSPLAFALNNGLLEEFLASQTASDPSLAQQIGEVAAEGAEDAAAVVRAIWCRQHGGDPAAAAAEFRGFFKGTIVRYQQQLPESLREQVAPGAPDWRRKTWAKAEAALQDGRLGEFWPGGASLLLAVNMGSGFIARRDLWDRVTSFLNTPGGPDLAGLLAQTLFGAALDVKLGKVFYEGMAAGNLESTRRCDMCRAMFTFYDTETKKIMPFNVSVHQLSMGGMRWCTVLPVAASFNWADCGINLHPQTVPRGLLYNWSISVATAPELYATPGPPNWAGAIGGAPEDTELFYLLTAMKPYAELKKSTAVVTVAIVDAIVNTRRRAGTLVE